jgi:hypothetical protein
MSIVTWPASDPIGYSPKVLGNCSLRRSMFSLADSAAGMVSVAAAQEMAEAKPADSLSRRW